MTTIKIYYGAEKPFTALGVNQCRLLSFAERYPSWHSYNKKCRATLRALEGLSRRGSIFWNKDSAQFCIAYDQYKES
ncbi:MAG: hypothetical protein KGI54_14575 [Pseudomonadota bacterium]|nr:hypothetical protein [Pseudomonadota bacterium]